MSADIAALESSNSSSEIAIGSTTVRIGSPGLAGVLTAGVLTAGLEGVEEAVFDAVEEALEF